MSCSFVNVMRSSLIFPALFVLICVVTLAGCDGDNNKDGHKNSNDTNPYEGYTSEQYSGQENWLCRPDIEDKFNVCQRDLSTTLVFADGTRQLEASPAADDSAIDCFYLYPTVSNDVGDNSDLVADAEIGVTFTQAARYRSACKMFAPLYRQYTISAIFSGRKDDPEVSGLAYGDVLDDFKYYIANGEGRGFLLIGHSQGSTHLIRLIQEEIEADPYLSSRMVAAHLIGWVVELPNDSDVGATLKPRRRVLSMRIPIASSITLVTGRPHRPCPGRLVSV